MEHRKAAALWSRMVRGWLMVFGLFVLLLAFPIYASANLWYWETKGPFKNWMQVVDWDADGDLDVIVSHTRWETVNASWAGIGQWINQGNGTFRLIRDQGEGGYPFGGYAAGIGDVDQDGDLDMFTQDFGIKLMVNQGGAQGGALGTFRLSGGINAPPAFNQGYRDMGGTITMGDLNGDDRIDAFVASCCYGKDAITPGDEYLNASSVSWIWINDGRRGNLQTGNILPMDFLDGLPIRQVALGDLDGDGDLDVFAAVGQPSLGRVESNDDMLLLNDGLGNLSMFRQNLGNTDSTSVALGDVNGDGNLDALVGTNKGANLWINQGKGSGSNLLFISAGESFETVRTIKERLGALFSAVTDRLYGLYFPYGSVRTKAVFLADLDGDNNLDALLARLWGAEIWWNDGQGHFQRSSLQFAYREDTGVAVADFDGDGDQDIFIGRNEVDYQTWWNNGQGEFSARIQ